MNILGLNSNCRTCKQTINYCICKNRCGECGFWGKKNCKCKVMSINPNYYKKPITNIINGD